MLSFFRKSPDAEIEGLRELVKELKSLRKTTFEKAQEYRRVQKEWNRDREYFEKSSFSSALAPVMQEKFEKASSALKGELDELSTKQGHIKNQISKVLKKSKWLQPLMLFEDFIPQETFYKLVVNLTKAHQEGLVKDSTLQNLTKYRQIELNKAKVYVKDERTQYADVILIDDENKILFTVRNKEDDFEPGKYCLPGGHIEGGESPKAAARRELLEETGIEISLSDLQPCGEYIDNKSHIHYFCAKSNLNPVVLEEREQQQWERVPFDEVGQRPLLMNLKENLENLIEIPKVILNPIAENADKLYFWEGSLIQGQADVEKVLNFKLPCKAVAEGYMSWDNFEALKITEGGQDIVSCMIMKTNGSFCLTPKLLPSVFDIEKGYKYLRKVPDGHGGWRYIYEEAKTREKKHPFDDVWDINKERDFGEVYKEFEGKPKEAFDKIISKRGGHAVNVFKVKLPVVDFDKSGRLVPKKDSNGRTIYADTHIDVVWGKADKQRHTGYGLAHIIDKHLEYQDDFETVEELRDKIIEVMDSAKEGRGTRLQETFLGDYRIVIQDRQRNKIMVSLKFKKNKETGGMMVRHYVLTSYDNGVSGASKVRTQEDQRKKQKYFAKWNPGKIEKSEKQEQIAENNIEEIKDEKE